MRRWLAFAALGLVPACGVIETGPVATDEVITELRVRTATGAAPVADGVSFAEVWICTVDDDGRDPALTAELHLSLGRWVVDGGDDATTRTISLADRCAGVPLTTGLQAGTVHVEATLGDYMLVEVDEFEPAVPTAVQVEVAGALGEGDSMLAVTADIDAADDGQMSIGTEVAFTAAVTPASAIGHFERRVVAMASGGRSAETTYVASEAITAVTFCATARNAKAASAAATGDQCATVRRP